MRIVIKFRWGILEDDATVRSLARQVAALAQQGHEILVGTGGGRLFTATLKRMAIESKFTLACASPTANTRCGRHGLRRLLNKKLAAENLCGRAACRWHLCRDARCLVAEPMVHNEIEGGLGFVGYLNGLNAHSSNLSGAKAFAPLRRASVWARTTIYNINADHMAAACAEYLGASS